VAGYTKSIIAKEHVYVQQAQEFILQECADCGAVVSNTAAHDSWHMAKRSEATSVQQLLVNMEDVLNRLSALESAPVRKVLVKSADIEDGT